MLLELPLAYFVGPISSTPGRVPVTLDLEAQRQTELDGECALRLRRPCLFQGVEYQAMPPVAPVPVRATLSATDITTVQAHVDAVLSNALAIQVGDSRESPPPPLAIALDAPPKKPPPRIVAVHSLGAEGDATPMVVGDELPGAPAVDPGEEGLGALAAAWRKRHALLTSLQPHLLPPWAATLPPLFDPLTSPRQNFPMGTQYTNVR